MTINIVILLEFIEIQEDNGVRYIIFNGTLYIVLVIESGKMISIFYLNMFKFFSYTPEQSGFFKKFPDFFYNIFRCIFIAERKNKVCSDWTNNL